MTRGISDRGMRTPLPRFDPSVPTDLCYVDVGDSLSCLKEFRAHCVDSATHATKTEADAGAEAEVEAGVEAADEVGAIYIYIFIYLFI